MKEKKTVRVIEKKQRKLKHAYLKHCPVVCDVVVIVITLFFLYIIVIVVIVPVHHCLVVLWGVIVKVT